MKLYTTKEAGELLGLSERTVQRYCREGKLSHIKHGRAIRLSDEDITNYITNNRKEIK